MKGFQTRLVPHLGVWAATSKQLLGANPSGVSPHPWTTRFSYTVPSGTRAVLVFARVACVRVSAPTVSDLAVARILHVSGASEFIVRGVDMNNATVGAFQLDGGHVGMMVESGDRVDGRTTDISTGGTVTYELTALLLQVPTIP